MLMKKKELLICLCARGYENAVTAEETLPDMDEQSRQSLKTALVGLGLLESDPQVEGSYRFSAYGQVILDTIGKPDVMLEAEHLKRNIRRSLYLRDAFYVCVEEMDEDDDRPAAFTPDFYRRLRVTAEGTARSCRRGSRAGRLEAG